MTPRLDPQRPIPGPIVSSMVAALVSAGIVGAGGWALAERLRPGQGWAAWPAAGSVFLAFIIGLVVIHAWSPRPMERWAVAILAGQGVRFGAGVTLAGVLLYSLPPAARAVGGVTFAAGYLMVVLTESWVMARHFRRVLGPPVALSSGNGNTRRAMRDD